MATAPFAKAEPTLLASPDTVGGGFLEQRGIEMNKVAGERRRSQEKEKKEKKENGVLFLPRWSLMACTYYSPPPPLRGETTRQRTRPRKAVVFWPEFWPVFTEYGHATSCSHHLHKSTHCKKAVQRGRWGGEYAARHPGRAPGRMYEEEAKECA